MALGLIIPIVFRGENYIPPEIKERRQYYDFSDFLLSDEAMWKHPKYALKIREIAEYICDRCNEFENLPDTFGECEAFELPTEDDVQEWLNAVVSADIPFPGREGER